VFFDDFSGDGLDTTTWEMGSQTYAAHDSTDQYLHLRTNNYRGVTTDEEIANGTWKGYAVGDYHYIEFDNEFVLHEGVPYNYTIKTDSYPQIIHEHVFNTMTDGEIICAKFVDANGKVYDDWIPAVRLE
jgi:hypothetical protein